MRSEQFVPGCFIMIWLGGWTLGTLLFDGLLIYTAVRQLMALTYETTEGIVVASKIDSVKVHHNEGPSGDSYIANVEYRYRVGQREFTSNQRRYGDASGDYKIASRISKFYVPGKAVPVYYSSRDPSEAVLTPGLEGSEFFLANFLTPFNIVMLSGWVWFRRWIRNGPRAQTATQSHNSEETPASPPVQDGTWLKPLAIGAGITLALSFATTFVLGYTFGANPPLPIAATVLAVCWGLGIAAVVWCRARLPSKNLSET